MREPLAADHLQYTSIEEGAEREQCGQSRQWPQHSPCQIGVKRLCGAEQQHLGVTCLQKQTPCISRVSRCEVQRGTADCTAAERALSQPTHPFTSAARAEIALSTFEHLQLLLAPPHTRTHTHTHTNSTNGSAIGICARGYNERTSVCWTQRSH